jgi:hypothetical protein
VFEPMLLILAWPVGVFAWVLLDLHRHREPAKEAAPAPAPAAIAAEHAPAWNSSVSAAA